MGARPLEVTLYGSDSGSGRVIRETIATYGLERQVTLGGFVSDVESVWAQHHGLVLPSRYEGNPLALIEALLCGRMAIATDVGRAAELVEEGAGGSSRRRRRWNCSTPRWNAHGFAVTTGKRWANTPPARSAPGTASRPRSISPTGCWVLLAR